MYMYTMLKEALMGKGGKPNSNWSPNSIKAIIITQNFILVAYHCKPPKLTTLDYQQSVVDIQKNGSQGALHNLLSNRQLSCLEEIYVDSVFKNYLGLMNLDEYVNKLKSTVSRLRYYGYIQALDGNNAYDCYYKASINGYLDYTYAGDNARKDILNYVSTENVDWYTKYYLRPDTYSLDKDKGVLHTWFKKVEVGLTERKKAELENLKQKGKETAISTLFSQDLTYAEDILNFYQLIGKLKEKQNHDNISKAVLTSIKECQSSRRLSKIDPELLQKSLTKNKVNIVGKGEFLIKQYKKEGLFSDKAEVDIDDLVSSAKEFRGFLDFPNLLYSICCNLVDNNNSSTKDVYLMMCILLSDEAAKAKGNLKGIFKNRMGTPSCVSWYMNLLLGLGGYTRESLNNALKRGENDGR